MCVYMKHENLKLRTALLKPENLLTNLLKNVTCDIDNEECMMNTCNKCPGFDVINDIVEPKMEDTVF